MSGNKTYPKLLRFDPVGLGRSKSIVIVGAVDPQHFTIVCCCRLKRDEAGRCRHLRAYLPLVKPWYRARMTIQQPSSAA